MLTKAIFHISIIVLSISPALSQTEASDSTVDKHFIGSTLFMLFNLSANPPNYYQLNYGYRITTKDVISLEVITWEYKGPLGRPYGPDYENIESNFPGLVKAVGVGIAYKRFIWRGIYAALHSTAFRQKYLDSNKETIQSGFQSFNSLRFGYHFKLLKNRIFIEPSMAFTSWPINTNLPHNFQIEENKWPKYFLFEPGLHFGINF